VVLTLSVGANAADAPPLSAVQAFERLKTNARVDWLVRLVAYDPANPRLQVDKLTALGAPAEDYTFVADYEELRGHTVEVAARLAGGAISPGQGLSAILFRLDRRPLFPAGARGMLQVIQEIDKRRAGESGYKPAGLESRLAPSELEALANRRVVSWAWNDYRALFPKYATVFSDLRSQDVSAFEHIGKIGRDWSVAGCSRLTSHHTSLRPDTMTLELADGSPYPIERFGVRVFLIRNLPIAELKDRKLIDFKDPPHERLPELENATPAPGVGR